MSGKSQDFLQLGQLGCMHGVTQDGAGLAMAPFHERHTQCSAVSPKICKREIFAVFLCSFQITAISFCKDVYYDLQKSTKAGFTYWAKNAVIMLILCGHYSTVLHQSMLIALQS